MAESILNNGFFLSDHSRMLGSGVYVSATLEKTQNYGPITFKLLVYPGRICKIDYQGHPYQKSWQGDFGSAWAPPHTMVRYQVGTSAFHHPYPKCYQDIWISGKLHQVTRPNKNIGYLPWLLRSSTACPNENSDSSVSLDKYSKIAINFGSRSRDCLISKLNLYHYKILQIK